MSFKLIIKLDPDDKEYEMLEETKIKTESTIKLWNKPQLQDTITELEAQIVEIQARIDILKEQVPKFTAEAIPK